MVTDETTKVYHHAKLYDYSTRGFYFESDFKPEPGTVVHIYMNKYSPKAPAPENCKGYRARVKWCKDILDEFTFYHGIGVEIFGSIK